MTLDLRSSELEHQFIQDRINSVEHNAAELCTQFSKYARRIGQLRDNGDELAESILKLSSKETINHSLRAVLTRFSDVFAAVQDYRNAEVQRLDHKVILQLSSYGQICKHAREDLKKYLLARTKELSKKQQLEKMRGKKPINWQQINEAEHEAEKAKTEATDATINLAKKIDDFEKRKLESMKKIFLEFVNIELLFHCKAVELFSTAYGTIKEIKVEEDLQEFRNHFKSPYTIGEVNLPSVSLNESTPNKEMINKTISEITPPKNMNPVVEDSSTISSSCTDLTLKSSTADNLSENKDVNDTQTFKMHRWNY